MKDVRTIYYEITGKRPRAIEPLYGGLNSINYLIDQSEVLRIKTSTIDKLYRPETEYRAERLVAGSGLTPQLLHFDQISGLKLTKYIPETTFLSKPPTEAQVIAVAKTLRTLHAIKPVQLSPFDPIARYETYKQASKITTVTERELNIVNYIKKLTNSEPLVFAHNDLVRGNILFQKSRIFIIDYEYAGCNHPLFDLASFITENNINNQSLVTSFLQTYDQEKNIHKHDFEMFCAFLDYLWFYWAQGMYGLTQQSIYKTIARMKWLRISNR